MYSSCTTAADGTARAVFTLRSSDATAAVYPHAFEAEYAADLLRGDGRLPADGAFQPLEALESANSAQRINYNDQAMGPPPAGFEWSELF